MRKVEYWRCTDGHGAVRDVGVPEHIEIGNVKLFVNLIKDGDRCRHSPVFRIPRQPLVLCQGTMKLEREEIFA